MSHPLRSIILLLAICVGCSKPPTGPSADPPVPPAPQPLTVTSVSPTAGLVNYASHFTVRGTGFKSGAVVTLGGTPGAVSALGVTSLQVTSPLTVEGTVDLVVTNPDGESVTLFSAVTFHVVSLTASPNSVAPRGPLSVSWTAPGRESAVTSFPQDWIGLYRAGASSNFGNELWWEYITSVSGTMTLTAPAQPGQYEFRYLPDDGEADVARVAVTVQ